MQVLERTLFPLCLADGVTHLDCPVEPFEPMPDLPGPGEGLHRGRMGADEAPEVDDNVATVRRVTGGPSQTSRWLCDSSTVCRSTFFSGNTSVAGVSGRSRARILPDRSGKVCDPEECKRKCALAAVIQSSRRKPRPSGRGGMRAPVFRASLPSPLSVTSRGRIRSRRREAGRRGSAGARSPVPSPAPPDVQGAGPAHRDTAHVDAPPLPRGHGRAHDVARAEALTDFSAIRYPTGKPDRSTRVRA